MAQTTEPYDGNGTRGSAGNALSFTFPYLKLTDVKVALNGSTLATTKYTFPTATTLQFNTGSETTLQETTGAPKTGVSILIYRDTNVDSARHVFGQGSAFKSKDLNENKEQSLYFDQEVGDTTNPKNFVTSAQISDGTSLSAADKTKLDTIEANAKDDQTGAEIKTLYEAESNTNAFTDAEKTKLGNVEANAKDDQTAAEIKSLYESNSQTNAFTDAEKTKLQSVEANAKDDQTATEIKSLYESNSDTNAFTDNDHTKLDGIESNAINAQNAAITNKLPLAGGTMTGDLTVSNTAPKITLNDTDHTKNYRLMTNSSGFKIQDGTNSNADLFTIQNSGKCLFHNDAQVNSNLTVEGNLIVNGTSTTLNTATINVDDKNFVLLSIDSPTDALANNGGFTLRGDTDKTFQWKDNTDSWTSSEHIALPDNKKLQLGDGRDFQIYFDGTVVRIKSDTTGTTSFQSQGTYLFRKGQSENLLKLIPDGAVELYYDAVKRLETTSDGVNVTGRIGVNTTSPSTTVHIKDTGNPVILLEDTSGSNQVGIRYKTSNQEWMAGLHGGQSQFKVSNSGSFATNDFLTIDTGGDFHFPVDDQRIKFGADADLEIFHGGSVAPNYPNTNVIKTNNTNPLLIETAQGGIAINNRTGSGATNFENMMTITPNGAVKAFYDGVKKLETKSTGIEVTGRIDATDDIHITNISPTLYFNDTTNTHDYRIAVQSNNFEIQDTSLSNVARLIIDDDGHVQIPNDSAKLQLGASQDLDIYHTGAHGVLDNITGGLFLKTGHATSGITLQNRTGNETMAKFLPNAAVELYYDNSKKLQTYSAGTEIIGNLWLQTGGIYVKDNVKLRIGNGTDLEIYHDGSHNYLVSDNGHLHIIGDGTNQVKISAKNGEQGIRLTPDGAFEAFYDDALKLETRSGGVTVTGTINASGGNFSNNLRFSDNVGAIFGASDVFQVFHNNGTSYISHNGSGKLELRAKHTEHGIKIIPDGAVELYHNNIKKLETTSTGVALWGGNLELNGPGGNVNTAWNDSSWEKIDFDNSYSATPNGPNRIVLHDNTGWKAGFGVSNNEIGMYTGGHIALYTNTTDSTASAKETLARFNDNGSADLYYDNSKKLETTSTGATVTTTSAANGIKNITTSTSGPSGGSDGDLWFTYVA